MSIVIAPAAPAGQTFLALQDEALFNSFGERYWPLAARRLLVRVG